MRKRETARAKGLCLLLAALLLAGTGFIGFGATLPVATAEAAEAPDEAALQAQYDAAQALFDAKDYEAAYQAFEALGKFSDSRARAADSKRKWKAATYQMAVGLYVAGEFREAKPIFEALDDYKESRSYKYKCTLTILREDFKTGKELYNAGDYEGALALFQSLGSFSNSEDWALDAAQRVSEQRQAAAELASYEKALELKAAGDLVGARDAFIAAGDCKDATDQLYLVYDALTLQSAYKRAEARCASGDYEGARALFAALEDYEDSAERAEQASDAARRSRYEQAIAAQADEPDRAYVLFLALGDYEDSADCAAKLKDRATDEGVYAAATALEQGDDYATATVGYQAIPAYQDSAERAAQASLNAERMADYRRALNLKIVGKKELANEIFKALGDFKDASVQIELYTGRFTCKQLRDDKTSLVSEVFTAPDGSQHRYQFYKGVHTWAEAKAFCEVLGGHLATLTTQEENDFVYQFMLDCGYLTAYFGLSDEERTGDWRWVTGEPFEFVNWHKREPSRCAKERYGMFLYLHKDGKWNDSHFYEDAEVDPGCSYICEWDD